MAKRQEIPDILAQARPQVDVMGDLLSGNPVAAADNSIIRSQLRYDYSLIPAEQREVVQAAAVDIVRNGKRAQESLILIGERLLEIKEVLEHGQFGDWCETEFSFSQRTAQNMMNVAQTFGGQKRNGVSLLGDATLYLLSAPSTPAAAREEVIEMAQATGTTPTKAEVKAVIDRYKPTMTQLAEMIETRPNLKSADLRAAARKRAGHWLYDTAASNAEVTWPGAWNQTTLVNALHYVADALDRANSTHTVQPAVTPSQPEEPTVSLNELDVVDSVTVRVDSGGKLLMDWDDTDWAAYQRKLEQRQAANVVPSEATSSRQQGAELAKCSVCNRPLSDPASAIAGVGPCCAAKRATAAGSNDAALDVLAPDRIELSSAAQKRNERIESVLRRFYGAQAAASEFEELTGVYTHTPAFRRVMENMISVLEANLV